MGCGMLVKGPVGIIIPLVGVIPYLTLTPMEPSGDGAFPFSEFFWSPLSRLLVCDDVSNSREALLGLAQANTTGQFMNPMEGHGGTLLFYVPVLLIGFFPWERLSPFRGVSDVQGLESVLAGQGPVTQKSNIWSVS